MSETQHAEGESLPARREMMAGGAVKAIVPQSMEDAYRLAKAVVAARMAPKGLDTPEACMIAILHGLEVGLTPMAALQRIAVVNGRPTIWGDGAIGLVWASGLCVSLNESLTGTQSAGDDLLATCTVRRKGQADPIVGTFSVADAKKAGLWGKGGPWTQYPKRMLQMRARAFALRDGFADVLGGLYLREEFDGGEMRDITPQAPEPPAPPPPPAAKPAPRQVAAKPAPADALDPPAYLDRRQKPERKADAQSVEQHDFGPAGAIDDPEAYLRDLDAELGEAGGIEELGERWAAHEIQAHRLFPPDRDKAQALFERHEHRIGRGVEQ